MTQGRALLIGREIEDIGTNPSLGANSSVRLHQQLERNLEGLINCFEAPRTALKPRLVER
jgi:hypothetical protein